MSDRTRIYNCVGLHDFKLEDVKWKEWFDYALSIFTKHNLEPMRLGVGGEYYGDSVKTLTFKGGKKKLNKFNFEGIRRLGFMVMENKDDYTSNFIVDANIFPKLKSHRESFASFCIDEKLEPFVQDIFEDIAAKFFDFTKAKYGYYYSCMLQDQPEVYPMGGASDFFNKSEEERRRRLWEKQSRFPESPYKTGDMRDIFKLNFLSREHLIRDVRPPDQKASGSPLTLEAWINSSSEHGALKQLREGFWSWYVPYEQIESVRNALLPSGIILCV